MYLCNKSSTCGYKQEPCFHIVPVPVDPFAEPTNADSDPLRCPVFCPLADPIVKSLPGDQLKSILIAILRRFGFISMSCMLHEKRIQYIHLSGGMFVLVPLTNTGNPDPNKIGFYWSWNFMLGKRYRSQYTGDEAFQDKMLADFRHFCSDHDNRLSAFLSETLNK